MRITLSWRMRSRVPADASLGRITAINRRSVAKNVALSCLHSVAFMLIIPPVVQRADPYTVQIQAQIGEDRQAADVELSAIYWNCKARSSVVTLSPTEWYWHHKGDSAPNILP